MVLTLLTDILILCPFSSSRMAGTIYVFASSSSFMSSTREPVSFFLSFSMHCSPLVFLKLREVSNRLENWHRRIHPSPRMNLVLSCFLSPSKFMKLSELKLPPLPTEHDSRISPNKSSSSSSPSKRRAHFFLHLKKKKRGTLECVFFL